MTIGFLASQYIKELQIASRIAGWLLISQWWKSLWPCINLIPSCSIRKSYDNSSPSYANPKLHWSYTWPPGQKITACRCCPKPGHVQRNKLRATTRSHIPGSPFGGRLTHGSFTVSAYLSNHRCLVFGTVSGNTYEPPVACAIAYSCQSFLCCKDWRQASAHQLSKSTCLQKKRYLLTSKNCWSCSFTNLKTIK